MDSGIMSVNAALYRQRVQRRETCVITGLNDRTCRISRRHFDRLSDVLEKLKSLPVSDVILYGSCARSEAKYDSDIDVIVLTDNITHELQTQIRFLRSEYGDGTGPDVDIHCYTKENYDKSETTYLKIIHKEGIILWES